MTSEAECLRQQLWQLREEAHRETTDDALGDAEAFNQFAEAALVALGPDGCVTKQLEQTRKCELAAYEDLKRLRAELTLANARWDRVCTWQSEDGRYIQSKGGGPSFFPSMKLFKELVDSAKAYVEWRHHGLASENDVAAEQNAYDNLMAALRHVEKGPRA